MHWATIRYRDFYDVPRIFITVHDGKQYLFDCPFDDDLDEYSDRYRVYQLPAILEDELEGSWERLPERAVSLLGQFRLLKFSLTQQSDSASTQRL